MKQARHQAAAHWPLQLSGEVKVPDKGQENDNKSNQLIEKKALDIDEVMYTQ